MPSRIYEVTWAKNGDKGESAAEKVEADSYSDVGPFIEFSVYDDEGFLSPVLRIRASDVQAIKWLNGPSGG